MVIFHRLVLYLRSLRKPCSLQLTWIKKSWHHFNSMEIDRDVKCALLGSRNRTPLQERPFEIVTKQGRTEKRLLGAQQLEKCFFSGLLTGSRRPLLSLPFLLCWHREDEESWWFFNKSLQSFLSLSLLSQKKLRKNCRLSWFQTTIQSDTSMFPFPELLSKK